MSQCGMESAHEAARLFRSTGALSDKLLRTEICRAWERSHCLGADPRRLRAERLTACDTERLAVEKAAFLTAARPYLSALSHASGSHRHAAMLCDARAIVLEVMGDEQTIHGPEQVPGPGSLLDESTAGANGLGTALAAGGYVEIIGPEHFIEGFNPFTCQGTPVRDSTGQVVGALSTSVRRPEVSHRLRELLVCAAHGIEAELLHASLKARLAQVLANPSPTQEVLERLYLDLTQRRAAARMRVELASDQFRRDLSLSAPDVLKVAFASLADFRREAAIWRELVSPQQQPPAPVLLDEAVRNLGSLLEGEAVNHRCKLVLHMLEPVTVQADPGALRLALLRALLAALAQGRGGAVLIEVRRQLGQGMVSLAPKPGTDVLSCAPRPITVAAPVWQPFT